MINLSTQTRKLALAVVAAIVAGPPMGALVLQWVLALRSVLLPETTCWIAAVDDHFLFSTELLVAYFFLSVTAWLPAAFIAAGLALFALGRGSSLWFIVVTVIGAVASTFLLYFGSSIAVGVERDAYIAIRDSC